jgi:hypothetical protein
MDHSPAEQSRQVWNQFSDMRQRIRLDPASIVMLAGAQLYRPPFAQRFACVNHLHVGSVDGLVQPGQAIDRDGQSGFLRNLSMKALLYRLVEAEMAAGQVPVARTVYHPWRSPQHQDPAALRDHTMNPNPELRLCHRLRRLPSQRLTLMPIPRHDT